MVTDRIRRIILDQAYRAKVGHIGSSLSIVEILAALYGSALRIKDPKDADRDRFILAKGHASLALYAVLFLKGWISEQELQTYCGDGTLLGVHPEHALPGVDFSTGSLGQGITYGAGAALATRVQGSGRRVFVLMSDAECNEGSVWEAVMFAAHHQLANLTVIVDVNGQQALGPTEEVLNIAPLAYRWRAFGWDTIEVDGHDPLKIASALSSRNFESGPPHALLAQTIAGKGVSFMERQVAWHYLPMSEQEYKKALKEIEPKQ